MDKSIFLEPIFQETFVEMVKFEYYRIIDISRYTNQHTHTQTIHKTHNHNIQTKQIHRIHNRDMIAILHHP